MINKSALSLRAEAASRRRGKQRGNLGYCLVALFLAMTNKQSVNFSPSYSGARRFILC